MATRFGKFQTLAQRLIAKNGREITYRQRSETNIDDTQPWLGKATNNSDTKKVPAVFVEFTSKEKEESLIQMGDKKCLIAATALPNITPKTKDILVDGSTQWHIVNVMTLQPGNTAETIMYTLQVRS